MFLGLFVNLARESLLAMIFNWVTFFFVCAAFGVIIARMRVLPTSVPRSWFARGKTP